MTRAAMATPGQSKSPWYASSPPAITAIRASLWNAVEGWPSAQMSGGQVGPSSAQARLSTAGFSHDEYPRRLKSDRVGVELLQGHLKRSAVARRAGQPLG